MFLFYYFCLRRPAYSTANNLMGTNTVRSVNSRMSYPPKSSFVNSNAYMRSLPTYTFNGTDGARPTILCVHPGVVFEPQQDPEMVNHVEVENVLSMLSNQQKVS